MWRLFKFLFFTCIIVPGISSTQLSDEYINHKWLADSLYKKENYTSAVIEYREICKLKDVQRSDYYWACCCYCKLNKTDSALDFLTIGAKLGMLFEGGAWDIDHDTNLAPLHKLSGWAITRTILINNFNSTSQNDSLRVALQFMWIRDQDNIKQAIRDSLNKNQWHESAKENETELKNIIIKFGWPGFKMVGMNGAGTACLIAQHSDNDTAFQ